MKAFEHARPASLAAALELLPKGRDQAARDGTRIVAGGQDLYTEMKERLAQPDVLVDVKGLGLDGIERGRDGGLAIGATVTLAALEEDPAVRERFRALHEAAASVASVTVAPIARPPSRPRSIESRPRPLRSTSRSGSARRSFISV